MATELSEPCDRIHWPEDLDESTFLSQYWQRRPLLIRQALPDFDTPLSADELAGLSLEPDTTPRLITQDAQGDYHLEHGPFEPGRYDELTGNDWSLLVTDVEKHLPALALYLQPFAFLPTWRIDDLMVSYAPVGASVGAHVDEYDVFLLQASGKRQWSIDARCHSKSALNPTSELKLLADFEPSDCWELVPGDLLYLPPGVPHHGVASEEPCTTWSIGFRAPIISDVLMRLAEMVCEAMPTERITDGPLQPAVPGEISQDALQRIAGFWRQAVKLDDRTLAQLTGRLLTESVNAPLGESDEPNCIAAETNHAVNAAESVETMTSCALQVAPFSRVAWITLPLGTPSFSNTLRQPKKQSATGDISDHDARMQVQLFVDGDVHVCSRQLAIDICRPGALVSSDSDAYTDDDQALLRKLQDDGNLVPTALDTESGRAR